MAATWVGLGAARDAGAVTFDAQGQAALAAGAVYTQSFEAGLEATGLTVVEAADALHGGAHAVVDSVSEPVRLQVPVAPGKAALRARLYARGNRVVARLEVAYADGGAPGHEATLFPTGRVTSDGWYEIASAPLSIDGARAPKVTLSLVASKADVDAIEVVAEGAYRAPVACAYARDAACLDDQVCVAGYCRDGDPMVPPLPPGPERAAAADYLAGRLKAFFGGVQTRADRLPAALATLEAMKGAKSAWAFWNGLATAVHRLRDWHTRVQGPPDGLPGRGTLPICVVEGRGDLSQGLWPSDPKLPDLLVSHVGPEGTSGLKPGDRVVAVNGMHPVAFVESLDDVDWGHWRADDPEAHAEAAERLRGVVRRWAKSLTVVRCEADGTCKSPETIEVASLPQIDGARNPGCDHRPLYHLESGNPDPVDHELSQAMVVGRLAGTEEGEQLYGALFDSVYLEGGVVNPYKPAIETLRAEAKGVVLDHRRGNGGTELAASYLTTLFRAPPVGAAPWASTPFMGTYGWFDAPFDAADGQAIYKKMLSVGNGFDVGAKTARLDLRTAVLTARDGSASDYLLLGLRGSGANVRVFGRRTAGAFSSFLVFDYFGGLRFQVGSGDMFAADGASLIGHGVQPDEEVLPLQSDLVKGIDTAHERALAWLREAP